MRVISNSSLFKENVSIYDDDVYKDVELCLKNKFHREEFPFESIEDFIATYIPECWLDAQKDYPLNGGFSYANSNYLNFHDKSSPIDEIDWKRFKTKLTDASRKITRKKAKEPTESDERRYNEFFITSGLISQVPREHINTWYDIMLLFGIRREQLFVKGLSERIYNIGLPITRVQISDTSKSDGVKSSESMFLLCPIITLHRKPNKIQFRKTISVSLILVPISGKSKETKISGQEVFDILWDVGEPTKLKFVEKSPLLQFLGLTNENNEFTKAELIKEIMKTILSLITENGYSKDEENNNISTQIDYSLQRVVTYFKENSEGERSHVFGNSKLGKIDERNLRMMVHPYHYFIDRREGKEVFPSIFKLEDLIVTDKFRFDSSYLLFYNPRDSYLAGIHYQNFEEFPKLSMKWYFFFDLYMIMEISLIKVMLHSFYKETEEHEDLQHVIDIEKELVTDLDEFYDLDLSFTSYKDSYEKIKEIAGINESYKAVKNKLNDLKNYFSLTQQRRINLAIVTLTVFTVFAVFLSVNFSGFSTWQIYAFVALFGIMGLTMYWILWKYGKGKN